MKKRNNYIIGIGIAVAAVAVSAPLAGQSTLKQTLRRNPPGFGLMTIAADQNVRLLVVNTTMPQPDLPPNPCRAYVAFVDGAGARTGASAVADLLPGESIAVDAFDNDGRGLSRLRPMVAIDQDLTTQILGPALPPNPCVSTVEVFDVATGRTSMFVDGAGRAQEINAVTVVDERQ